MYSTIFLNVNHNNYFLKSTR